MNILLRLACTLVIGFASASARAGECVVKPDRIQLTSDTVLLSFSIATGAQCLQALKGKTMLIDSIKVLRAPTEGTVEFAGPAFRYIAPAKTGADTFELEVTGSDRGIRGASTVQVQVAVH